MNINFRLLKMWVPIIGAVATVIYGGISTIIDYQGHKQNLSLAIETAVKLEVIVKKYDDQLQELYNEVNTLYEYVEYEEEANETETYESVDFEMTPPQQEQQQLIEEPVAGSISSESNGETHTPNSTGKKISRLSYKQLEQTAKEKLTHHIQRMQQSHHQQQQQQQQMGPH